MHPLFQCPAGHQWELALAANSVETFCEVFCPVCGAAGTAREAPGPSYETLPPSSGAPANPGSTSPVGAPVAPPTLSLAGAAAMRPPANAVPAAPPQEAPPTLSVAGAAALQPSANTAAEAPSEQAPATWSGAGPAGPQKARTPFTASPLEGVPGYEVLGELGRGGM